MFRERPSTVQPYRPFFYLVGVCVCLPCRLQGHPPRRSSPGRRMRERIEWRERTMGRMRRKKKRMRTRKEGDRVRQIGDGAAESPREWIVRRTYPGREVQRRELEREAATATARWSRHVPPTGACSSLEGSEQRRGKKSLRGKQQTLALAFAEMRGFWPIIQGVSAGAWL